MVVAAVANSGVVGSDVTGVLYSYSSRFFPPFFVKTARIETRVLSLVN